MFEPMLRMRPVILAVVPAAFLTACGITGPTVCTAEAVPAVSVEVRDAETGDPAAQNSVLILRDGEFVDSVTGGDFPSRLQLSGAYERPGSYDVTVEKDGYDSFFRANVEVEDRECHVATARLEAFLEPATASQLPE